MTGRSPKNPDPFLMGILFVILLFVASLLGLIAKAKAQEVPVIPICQVYTNAQYWPIIEAEIDTVDNQKVISITHALGPQTTTITYPVLNYDGDPDYLNPLSFSIDIDGDGEVDFIFLNQRFLSSCVGDALKGES